MSFFIVYVVFVFFKQKTAYEMRISDCSSDVCSSDLLKIVDQGDSGPLVSPSSLDADIQISYVSGGPAGGLPVSVSGVLRDRQVRSADYEDYRSEERRVGKECERTCRSRRSP